MATTLALSFPTPTPTIEFDRYSRLKLLHHIVPSLTPYPGFGINSIEDYHIRCKIQQAQRANNGRLPPCNRPPEPNAGPCECESCCLQKYEREVRAWEDFNRKVIERNRALIIRKAGIVVVNTPCKK